MKESAKIAHTFAQNLLAELQPKSRFFADNNIHLHVPEGATPKDGPSAGITMCVSLLSLALGRAVKPNIAMTGELTVTGRILKIGGLREKLVAAKRARVECIYVPQQNQTDWEELDDYLKEGVRVVFVSDFKDAIDSLLML